MGILSDFYRATYDGNIIDLESRIVIQKRGCQFTLTINNEKVDQRFLTLLDIAMMGKFRLIGNFLDRNGEHKNVVVLIKQGFLGSKYVLEIDGVIYPMTELRY